MTKLGSCDSARPVCSDSSTAKQSAKASALGKEGGTHLSPARRVPTRCQTKNAPQSEDGQFRAAPAALKLSALKISVTKSR